MTRTLHVLGMMLVALAIAPAASAKPVDVQTTGDANGDVAAVTLLGDANGGLLAASLLGDVESRGVAVTILGDAHGGLALSIYGPYCSDWFKTIDLALVKNTLTCDGNGVVNRTEPNLLQGVGSVPLAVDEPWPPVVDAPGCGRAANVQVALPVATARCGSGCSRSVNVAIAILADGEACADETCDQSVNVNIAVGGESGLCNSSLLRVVQAAQPSS